MTFDYFKVTSVYGQLEIEDPGNCAIKALNDDGEEYYLIIDTTLGSSRIFTYGPCVPDLDQLPKSVNCHFLRIIYNNRKINKVIDDFLNDRFAKITSAEVVEAPEILKRCKGLITYMNQKELY